MDNPETARITSEIRRSPRRRLFVIAGFIIGTLLVVAGSVWLWQTLGDTLFATTLHREVIQVPPSLRAVTQRTTSIIALRRSADGNSPLLLFLPATGSTPKLYASFETSAADNGYHVLAIPYANRRTERGICQTNSDCYDAVRDEQLTGTKTEFLPLAATQASVQSTIAFALHQLTKTDPNGGWGGYAPNNSIDWSHIVVSGHSQGGGLAAYIAHQYGVRGVIMFSSPNDIYLPTHLPASWVNSPSATPISRYYGLMDVHDNYAPSTTAVWHAMLPDIHVQKSDGLKEYDGQLFTTNASHFPEHTNAHFAVATDESYQPLWQYFLEKLY